MSTAGEEFEVTLSRRLRSWSPRRRRVAMAALSSLSTPTAIELLKGVVTGAKKSLFLRHRLRQQLDAIEFLGLSSSREALEFLEILYTPTITVEHEEGTCTYGAHSDTISYTDSYEVYTYHNACGGLKEVLGFRVQIYGAGCKYITDNDREEKMTRYPHAILRTAIESLRTRLEGEPTNTRTTGSSQGAGSSSSERGRTTPPIERTKPQKARFRRSSA